MWERTVGSTIATTRGACTTRLTPRSTRRVRTDGLLFGTKRKNRQFGTATNSNCRYRQTLNWRPCTGTPKTRQASRTRTLRTVRLLARLSGLPAQLLEPLQHVKERVRRKHRSPCPRSLDHPGSAWLPEHPHVVILCRPQALHVPHHDGLVPLQNHMFFFHALDNREVADDAFSIPPLLGYCEQVPHKVAVRDHLLQAHERFGLRSDRPVRNVVLLLGRGRVRVQVAGAPAFRGGPRSSFVCWVRASKNPPKNSVWGLFLDRMKTVKFSVRKSPIGCDVTRIRAIKR